MFFLIVNYVLADLVYFEMKAYFQVEILVRFFFFILQGIFKHLRVLGIPNQIKV